MGKYESFTFSETASATSSYKSRTGCFVKITTGVVLVLVAVVIAIGVGLIVHFTEKDNSSPCSKDQVVLPGQAAAETGKNIKTTPSPPDLSKTCRNMATNDGGGICQACPHSTCSPPLTTAAPPGSQTPAPQIEFVRLPKTIAPVQYNLVMTPNIYGPDPDEFTFDGSVDIKIKCKTATDKIIIHSKQLVIDETNVRPEVAPEDIKIDNMSEDTTQQLLTFTLNKNMLPENIYHLTIKFTGPLKKDLSGLYLSSYQQDNVTRYLATTQFQPTDARKAFPCFDEPGFKAIFKITVLRQAGWHSLSNSPINSTVDRNNMKADIFEPTFPMSTYLVAFVVSKFGNSSGRTQNNIEYGAWAKPESVPYTQEALRLGINIITYYEQLFGIPFPLKKQDMIAIPDYPLGGMENWGLVTYREEAMLFNPKTNSEYSKQRVTKVIAHELSHQWFGDLVTMQWWDDLWLNEGFATYMEYVGTNFSHPEWNIFDQFAVGDLYDAFDFDGHRSSHPIYVPVSTTVQIGEIFDRISYSKGGSVIRMMRHFLGGDTFDTALTTYLTELKYGVAEHNILFDKMNEQATKDGKHLPFTVKDIMDTWILQMNYPIVMVTRSEGGKLKLEQKRFLMDKHSTVPDKYNSTFGYIWKIPFSYTSSKEFDFDKDGTSITWLDGTTKEITDTGLPSPSDKDSWVIGNLQQYGVYRVTYEHENWRALVKQLKTDHKAIPIINRGQIIDDSWNLARSDQLSIEIALEALEYLNKEMEYVVWVTAKQQLKFLDTMLSKTDAYGLFQSFMKKKVTQPYELIKLHKPDSTHMESLLRSQIVATACSYGVEACVEDSKNLYQEWMDNPDSNPIPPDVQESVYCTAIADGGWEQWKFALAQLTKTIDVAQIALIQRALACSREPWILKIYLNIALNSTFVRSQDTLGVITSVSSNQIGNSMAWEFMAEHWQYLRASFGSAWFSFDKFISSLTKPFNTKAELKKLIDFIDTHPDLGTASTAFSQAVENTKIKQQFMEKNFNTIKTWLERVSTSTEPVVVKDVRLSRSVIPNHYELELKPDMYGVDPSTFRFYGNVKIHVDCIVSTENITLHINKLKIKEKSVKVTEVGQTQRSISVSRVGYDEERQFLIVYTNITANNKYVLTMDFDGPLKDDMTGLYLSSYNRGNKTIYLATTQMEPTDARKAFPCFDEPNMKATFQVTLLRKPHLMSLSNMPKQTTVNRTDGFVADRYETSRKMSTYLVAFVISDFVGKTAPTKHNITYGAWARPESVSQIDLALETGKETLTFYEDFFGIAFPLPKQDMIAIPDFAAGAMENWGLITYRENSMLYKKGLSSTADKQWTTETITHELAHQWFGDLVTMNWWDDLWLNEGFATFVQHLGADHMHPDWKMFDQFVVKELQDSMDFDGLISSHPMYAPVKNPAQINEIFDKISYSKGASIIRMMRFFIGEDTFKRGIKKYLERASFANAVHEDLWFAMGNQTLHDGHPMNVKAIMDTWTLQMNYPVVSMTRIDGGKVKVTQKRYLRNPDAKDPGRFTSKYGYTWIIPLTLTTSNNPNFEPTHTDVQLFGGNEQEIKLGSTLPDNGWVLANVKQYGYYRVNYDTQNWRSLIEQLKNDHTVIHVTNRAQIINDAWALAKSGDLDLTVALDTMEYLGNELDYVPWSAAIGELSYVEEMLVRTPLYGQFKKFMHKIIETPYIKLGMDNTNSSHMESKARSIIVSTACGNEVTDCQEEASQRFQDWMDRPDINRIDPDVKRSVLCGGISEGGADEWDFLYSQYKQSIVANERIMMLYALGCSQQPWILSRYLAMSLQPNEVRKQDADYVIRYVSGNPIGRDLTWNFMQENWSIFMERYGSGTFSLSHMISDSLASFNTELELEQIKAFQAAHPDMGSGTRAFEQSIEKTEGNVRWMKRNYDILKSWLDKVVETGPTSSVDDVRLPRSILPSLYELEIFPDFYKPDPKDFTFNGTVKIYISCVEATKNITLHIHKLTVDEKNITLEAVSGATVPAIEKITHDEDRQFLILNLDDNLQSLVNYTIEMKFTGPLADDMVGLYYSSYQRGSETVYMATTQMEPTDARKTFPCFDEPNMKARFQITVIRKQDLISLSNMQIQKTEPWQAGFVADHYYVSPIMSTYLVAFVVCDFAHINGTTKNGIYYGALAPKEMIDQAKFALDVGIDTITLYEEYFGIKFPLKKQEMIAIPDFAAGAMENWGLITYRETAMLYEPGVSSESNKQRVTTVITHELAHQWFGNLVTLDWWDDLWLNEGFATFVEYFGADNKFPDWTYFDIFTIGELQRAFDFDALVTSHPLFAPVANPDQINEVFDTISYSKGASVIRMMRFFVGEHSFQLGIQRYLKQREYRNADHNDLWAAMEQQIQSEGRSLEVKNIMNTWILQMNYPVVTLSKVSNTEMRANQKRFLTNPNAVDPGRFVSPYNYNWRVPITVTYKTNPNFNQTDADTYWHNNKEDVITLRTPMQEGDWFLANVQQYGFYRVNYEESNWVALTNQLKTDHKVIHTINRGQLINDAWNLANAGENNLKIALDMIDYLQDEMDYVPWHAALVQLGHTDSMLMRTELYGDYTTAIRNLITKPFTSVGLIPKETDGHLEKMLRISMSNQACGYGITECVETATDLFQEWMVDPGNNKIDPDVKQAVYCTGIAEGGALEWDFLYSQYKTSNNAAEKKRILYSLSCSKEIWILRKYLDMSLDSNEVRKQDASYVIIYVSGHSIGRDIAWNFVKDKWNTLLTEFGGGSFSFSNLISRITSSFNTEYDMQELVDFKTKNPDMGSGTRAYEQALEKTGSNIKWVQKNMDTIRSWLGDNKGNTLSKVLTDVRLPRSVLPSSYELEMFPNFYEADPAEFTFNGNISIHVSCVERTNNITLHAVNLDIDEQTIRLADKTGGEVAVSKVSQDDDRQFVIFHLSRYLTAGRNYTLKMSFSGQLTDNMVGMYYSSYQRGNQTIYMATTKMEPTHARKAFPCFDEPNMKATFRITLIRKPSLVSLSNMPAETTGKTWRDGYVADIYQESRAMSTYLVAMIVCDFRNVSGITKNNVTYNAWATPEKVSQARFALDVGKSTLTFYEDFFGIKFPLPKQDMIAIPDFAAGAMENWGLITYRETAMLYEPGVSSESNKQRVTTVITHELAHQWFGNLVTLDWWDDLWLNEGFATFVEYFGADHKFPDWKYFEIFAVDELQDAFESDALVTSHPMFAAVYNPTQIREVFDSISYSKGASIIRMMKFFVGDDVFQRGIQKYLNSRIYQNAVHDDLWMSMANVSSLRSKVKDIMDTWTLQMNYPVVTISRLNNTAITVSQKRFLTSPNATDPMRFISPFNYKWMIPLTVTSQASPNFNQSSTDVLWFNDKQGQIHLTGIEIKADEWFIGNVQQFGYYRVNYDQSNWNALIHQLKTGHTVIHTINRGQIINDAWSLSKAGELDFMTALHTIEYLENEQEYAPWRAASNQFSYVSEMLMMSSVYGMYEKVMKTLITKPFQTIGMNASSTDGHTRKMLRILLTDLACRYNVESCVSTAKLLFKAWMDDSQHNTIDPDIKQAVYCTAISEGGADEWDFLYSQYKTSNNAAEKKRILYSLSCTKKAWILSNYLALSLDPKQIRKQDIVYVISYVAGQPAGRDLTFNFISAKWDYLIDEFGQAQFSFANIIKGISRSFNTEFNMDQLLQFKRDHPEMSSGAQAFKQALEKTEANIRWMEENLGVISDWLNTRINAR